MKSCLAASLESSNIVTLFFCNADAQLPPVLLFYNTFALALSRSARRIATSWHRSLNVCLNGPARPPMSAFWGQSGKHLLSLSLTGYPTGTLTINFCATHLHFVIMAGM